MSLTLRRFIYLGFILLFVIIAPILILSVSGYRYNFKKNRLQKIGLLRLESRPAGTDVFINNEKMAATPIYLSLFPDFYQVRLEKENYYPWEKKLLIESQITTFASHPILFKKTQPQLITDKNFIPPIPVSSSKNNLKIPPEIKDLLAQNKKQNFTLAAKNKKAAIWDDFEIFLWDYSRKEMRKELVTRASQKIKQVIFLPPDDYLIFQINNTIKAIELDSRDHHNTLDLIKADKINQWFLDPAEVKLYFHGQIGQKTGWFEYEL